MIKKFETDKRYFLEIEKIRKIKPGVWGINTGYINNFNNYEERRKLLSARILGDKIYLKFDKIETEYYWGYPECLGAFLTTEYIQEEIDV